MPIQRHKHNDTSHLLSVYYASSHSAMFRKSTLVATITLALLSCATPVERGTGSSVPFAAPKGLTTEDGVFNHELAIMSTVRTHK